MRIFLLAVAIAAILTVTQAFGGTPAFSKSKHPCLGVGWRTSSMTYKHRTAFQLLNDDGPSEHEPEEADSFDGEGLAGYLVPYALAVVASIAVTAAFVEFVLLEY